jgi:hypothetical protein
LLEFDGLLELAEFLLGELVKRSERRSVPHAGFGRLLQLPNITQKIWRGAIVWFQIARIAGEHIAALAGLGIEQLGLDAVEDVDGFERIANVGLSARLPDRQNPGDDENRKQQDKCQRKHDNVDAQPRRSAYRAFFVLYWHSRSHSAP